MASNPIDAARRPRGGSTATLMVGLVLLAGLATTLRGVVAGHPQLGTAGTVFSAVFVQAVPFLALGVVVSGVVAACASGSLDGRLITVVGFTLREGGKTYLAGFYIICCAADARLHRLELVGQGADGAIGYPDGTWISVQGRVAPGPTPPAGPRLVVSEVQIVPEPADPYDYPS